MISYSRTADRHAFLIDQRVVDENRVDHEDKVMTGVVEVVD